MISYDDLALFARVAAKQSFVRAAEQLGMSTSTLSRRISQLEDELGVQLLYRTSRSVALTPAGQAYLDRCSPGLNALEEAIRALDDSDRTLRGEIRVTCPTYTGQTRIGPWLIDFLKEHPGLQLDLRLTNTMVDLIEEGIDVAFRVGPLQPSAFIARKLWEVRYALRAHRRHVRAAEDRIARDGLNALVDLPCVVSQRRTTWQFIDVGGDTRSISPRPLITVDDLLIAQRAVREGLGIGYLPANHLEETSSEVFSLDLGTWRLPTRAVYAVYPASRHLAPKVQRMVDYVVARCRTREAE